ncbi:MAG: putative sulfate transporter yvdB, partial [Chlamydiota bacterium]
MVDPVSEFTPKSYACFKEGYTFTKWRTDLVAGITVGVIALPLAMAFAIASGLTPEQGLFTAIVAGFLISLLGGSRFQIGGPTGAFVVIVYAIVQKTGYAGLAISTLIAGLLLILGGLFRLGSWIKFIPYPLVTGFTTGIALIIASSQVKEFFGLDVRHVPAPFAQKWGVLLKAMPTFDPTTVCIGFGALAFILVVRRYTPKIPWGIAAIFVTTLVCQLFDLNVDTVASRFGQIPHFLPTPHWPSFAIVKTHGRDILWDAFAIAFLGGIESLLSCVIADGMTGRRHKSNCELVGQGIANIASVLFGGLPATGAIARTAANIKSGAVT